MSVIFTIINNSTTDFDYKKYFLSKLDKDILMTIGAFQFIEVDITNFKNEKEFKINLFTRNKDRNSVVFTNYSIFEGNSWSNNLKVYGRLNQEDLLEFLDVCTKINKLKCFE